MLQLTGTFVCCSLFAATLAAQRRPPEARVEPKVAVTIDLQIGNEPYKVTSQATCRHAARASIYDIPAQQWSVQHSEESRSLALTLWRPTKGSGDMLSLAVSLGAASHTVNTVKTSGSGAGQGSGTATLATTGKGGAFTIDATTASGKKISGTIKCEAFTAPRVEGGD